MPPYTTPVTNSAEIEHQQHFDFDCGESVEATCTELGIGTDPEEPPAPLVTSTPSVAQTLGLHTIEVADWMPVRRNSVRAIFSITLTTIGLTIKGCMLRQGFKGSYFIAMPALPQVSGGRLQVDQKGRISYRSVLQFSDKESYKRFETLVLENLNRLGLVEACPQDNDREG